MSKADITCNGLSDYSVLFSLRVPFMILFKGGGKRTLNIEADSNSAIILD